MATCEERIDAELAGQLADLAALWNASGEEVEDLGNLEDYGLSFDYVPGGTDYNPDPEGYFRYQLSCGGPSDEFRYFACHNHRGWDVYRVEYWFKDWYDKASRTIDLTSEEGLVLTDIFYYEFEDAGVVESEYNKAMEEV